MPSKDANPEVAGQRTEAGFQGPFSGTRLPRGLSESAATLRLANEIVSRNMVTNVAVLAWVAFERAAVWLETNGHPRAVRPGNQHIARIHHVADTLDLTRDEKKKLNLLYKQWRVSDAYQDTGHPFELSDARGSVELVRSILAQFNRVLEKSTHVEFALALARTTLADANATTLALAERSTVLGHFSPALDQQLRRILVENSPPRSELDEAFFIAALTLLAHQALHRGAHATCIDLSNQVIAASPRSNALRRRAHAQRLLAIAHLREHDHAAARAALAVGLEEAKDSAHARHQLRSAIPALSIAEHQYSHALQVAEELQQEAELLQDPLVVARRSLTFGMTSVVVGRRTVSVRLVQQGHDALAKAVETLAVDDATGQLFCRLGRSLAQQFLGDLDTSSHHARVLLTQAHSRDLRWLVQQASRILADNNTNTQTESEDAF